MNIHDKYYRPVQMLDEIDCSVGVDLPVSTVSDHCCGRLQMLDAVEPTYTKKTAPPPPTIESNDLRTIQDLIARLGIDVVARVIDHHKAKLAG